MFTGTAMTSSLLSQPGHCHFTPRGEQSCMQVGTASLACHHTRELAGPCPAGRGLCSSPWAALLTTPAVARGWTRESLMQNYQSCFALRPMQSSTLASSPSKMLLVRNLCLYRQVLSSLIWRPGPNWCKEGRKRTIPSC